jgi:hypothetical protein
METLAGGAFYAIAAAQVFLMGATILITTVPITAMSRAGEAFDPIAPLTEEESLKLREEGQRLRRRIRQAGR